MALNKSTGNMYEFVTHTWNAIKGKCLHDCSYCYMKRWGTQKTVRIDYKELRTDLGEKNFIFVGSSCDIFAADIPQEWIYSVISVCSAFKSNSYLLQTKNPARIIEFKNIKDLNPIVCTTIETNRFIPSVMRMCPTPKDRAQAMSQIMLRKFVTIEPIMDFDLSEMVDLIRFSGAEQVNIGADSGRNDLPEPSMMKIQSLIDELAKFTRVENKRNLKRLTA